MKKEFYTSRLPKNEKNNWFFCMKQKIQDQN